MDEGLFIASSVDVRLAETLLSQLSHELRNALIPAEKISTMLRQARASAAGSSRMGVNQRFAAVLLGDLDKTPSVAVAHGGCFRGFAQRAATIDMHSPKIVIIEFNPTISKTIEFIQAKDMRIGQGSSLLSTDKLAKSKGYELVSVTRNNAIFVDRRFFDLFGIKDNSVNRMMVDESMITHIFCGYDGTVFVRGYGRSPWHQIPYKESKMQLLPRWAIKRYGDKNPIRRKLGKLCRRWRKEK